MEQSLSLFTNIVEVNPPINRQVLSKSLYKILSHLTLDEFVSILTNEFIETIEYSSLLNGDKKCQKTSLLFNPHRLNTRSYSSKLSLYESLQSESFCNGLARCILFQKGSVRDLLYHSLQKGINGVQYINEFPPHHARDLCKKYKLTLNSKVLDPCGGWGGRMLGSSCVVNSYSCFEPSTLTFEGLNKLYDFIKVHRPEFVANISKLPYEDSDLLDNYYDMAITSPPYYNTELYSDEETNSLNRYKTFDDWVNMFFYPLISKTMNALKPTGTFILNIGNRVYPLETLLFDQFKLKYKIEMLGNLLSGLGGLRKKAGAEAFFAITK